MKTKIIATYGPGMDSMDVLGKMARYIDVIRINTSHGDEAQWARFAENVRKAAKMNGKEIALLADLPGPKIRVGALEAPIRMKKGEAVALYHGKRPDTEMKAAPLDWDIYGDVKPGALISIGEYSLRLVVWKLEKGMIICEAVNDGEITSHKGIGVKGLSARVSPPTAEDLKRARFAVDNGFDFLAISFVMEAASIRKLRKHAGDLGIVSKIERKTAIENIDGIAEESDALMVARGDLAFDVDIDMIPTEQRRIIDAGRKAGKPVIVATQMLASMVNSPVPTRAEVNDIAHAIASGADCLMLSDETAVGKFPLESVMMMAKTAANSEQFAADLGQFKVSGIGGGIAFAAADLSDNYQADAIFAPTETGHTAKVLSALRPRSPIIALSASDRVRRGLAMCYGVSSMEIGRYGSTDEMFAKVRETARRCGAKRYIVVSGSPNKKGTTDTVKYAEL